MTKVDLKKEYKHLYQPSAKEITVVEVPQMNFLMVDGAGNPNDSAEFQEVCEVLYGFSYTLKFMSKKETADYTVMPLEGLWWADEMSEFSLERKEEWKWTLMIMQPDWITEAMFEEAKAELITKKPSPAIERVRFERYREGLSAQIMYIGPYAEEAPTIARIHDFIAQEGYELHGKHHEIYLGDPRRCAPEKLKTVIRQPMRPVTRV